MLRCYSSSVLLVVFRDHAVCTLHELSDLPPHPMKLLLGLLIPFGLKQALQ